MFWEHSAPPTSTYSTWHPLPSCIHSPPLTHRSFTPSSLLTRPSPHLPLTFYLLPFTSYLSRAICPRRPLPFVSHPPILVCLWSKPCLYFSRTKLGRHSTLTKTALLFTRQFYEKMVQAAFLAAPLKILYKFLFGLKQLPT